MSQLFDRRWFRVLIVLVALFGTVALASYQRRTGPTWPVPVDESLGGGVVTGELPRSHGGDGDATVSLETSSTEVSGEILWRRYPTSDPWIHLPMTTGSGTLTAQLPHQPPAGKLEYSVRLTAPDKEVVLPTAETAIIRFRGDVPAWVLIPHILLMFLALFVVFRATLGALLGEENVGRFVPWVLGLMIPGGFVLGPVVQKFAFGAYWTGWPFGGDWTDNKTLAALVAWLVAWAICRWLPRFQRPAVLFAAIVMFAVYLIPHSIHGSELDWEEAEGQETPAQGIGA